MSRNEPIIVLGGGGHAKVVVTTLRAAGHEAIEVYDDDPELRGLSILGAPILGPTAGLGEESPDKKAVLAIGDNQGRRRLTEELELDWITVIHPAAYVDPTARLGAGCVVFAGAVIQADCTLGRHVIVNTAATLDHDGVVGDFAHLPPGSNLAGSVTVGEGALLGIGSTVTQGRKIGPWATVGAGAVVVSDVEPQATVAGVPAQPLANPSE